MKTVRLSIKFDECQCVTFLSSLECYNLNVVQLCQNLPFVVRTSSNYVCSRETETENVMQLKLHRYRVRSIF